MRKRLLVCVLLSLAPLVSWFTTPLLPHTHDGFVHLARIAAYVKALGDFQIPVRWAGDLNYGYGMPLFNFIYHFPYLVSSFFLSLKFTLVDSFKLTLALSFLLSGVGMFLFAQELFQDKRKALLVTVFYQFAPFRFVELVVRGSFGEVYTYAFLPFVLWGIARLMHEKTLIEQNVLLIALSTWFLIISHNSVSLLFFIVCVFFVCMFVPSKTKLMYALFSLVLGLLLSAYYWFPAISEHKYTYGDLFMKNIYKAHFVPFQNFFIPNFTDKASLQTEGITTFVGLFHIGAILAALILFIAKRDHLKKEARLYLFCFILLLGSFFFMQKTSLFVWERVSLLRQFQFPWRFLAIVVFATSLLSVSFFRFRYVTSWAPYILIGGVLFSTVYFWKPVLGLDTIDESYYWNFPLNTTYFGETDLIWSAGGASAYPKARVEVIKGNAQIINFVKKSHIHTFVVNAGSAARFVDHTQYFPGWRVYVDGRAVPIQFQDPAWRGEITFEIPKGTHRVRIAFGPTKIRLASEIISLGTLFMLVGVVAYRTVKKYAI